MLEYTQSFEALILKTWDAITHRWLHPIPVQSIQAPILATAAFSGRSLCTFLGHNRRTRVSTGVSISQPSGGHPGASPHRQCCTRISLRDDCVVEDASLTAPEDPASSVFDVVSVELFSDARGGESKSDAKAALCLRPGKLPPFVSVTGVPSARNHTT